MTYNLLDDLSELTTIPRLQLENLFDLVAVIICHRVEEIAQTDINDAAQIDVGIGTLYIRSEDNQIKYKFIPNKKFDDTVRVTLNSGESPLVAKVEQILRDRIQNTYKDLFI